MNLIYRQFDPSCNIIIIEHTNINPKSEIEKKILSNPKTPLSDFFEDIKDAKNILNVDDTELRILDYNLDRIERVSLSRSDIYKFLEEIDNVDQIQDQDSDITSFIKSKNIDNELTSHLIHEFTFFYDNNIHYYKIFKNTSWMSFLNTDIKYTVRYIHIPKDPFKTT